MSTQGDGQLTDVNAAAISALYQKYQRPLTAYLTRITKDREAAEDLCQDSFAKAIRYWGQRDQDKDAVGWLYRIATNTAYDELRKQRRRPCVPLPETWEVADERGDMERQVSEAANVHAALRQLPARERVPLAMQVYAERSVVEIAEATQSSVSAVKTRLVRARARLREVYQQAEASR